MTSPSSPGSTVFHAAGLRLEDITHVFCTHLHFDHSGWNTTLRNGRWTPTFPNAKYIFHKDEYARWEAVAARGELPPGHAGGQPAGELLELQLPAGRRGGTGLLVDDAFELDDNFHAHPDARSFALPLLRHDPFARPGGGRDRRPHASRAAMPRAGLVDHLRHRSRARPRSRDGASWVRSPTRASFVLPIHFPHPTVGPGLRGRRPLPLHVRAVDTYCSARKTARGPVHTLRRDRPPRRRVPGWRRRYPCPSGSDDDRLLKIINQRKLGAWTLRRFRMDRRLASRPGALNGGKGP